MSGPHADDAAGGSPSLRAQLAVLVLVALACVPKLGNAFVWDDLPLIVESDFIHAPSNLPRAFLHDTMFAADAGKFQAQASLDTYRPVTLASFFIDAAISGRDPTAYHWDNLIVHLACTLLVLLLARKLLDPERAHVAPWAALWFGLHPVLGEAHLWINGRSDLWCTLFGLSALLVWWRDPRAAPLTHSPARLVGTYVLCLLGLLSKETLAPALIVALGWDLGCFHRPLRELRLTRAFLVRSLPLVLSIGSYLMLRGLALRGLHASAGASQVWMAAQHLPRLLVDGLMASVAPMRLMPRYLFEEYSAQGSTTSTLLALLVVCLAVATFFFRTRMPELAFGLTWFVVGLAPASLITTMPWYGFGRYLYLPYAGLLPAIVLALTETRRRPHQTAPALQRVGVALAALAICGFGARLAMSASMWNGPEAFYGAIMVEDPNASHGCFGAGRLLLEAGKPKQAIPFLEEAVHRNSKDHRYLNNLAVAYLRVERFADCSRVAEQGERSFPTQPKFPYLRALCAVATDSQDEAVFAIARALRVDPGFAPARALVIELSERHTQKAVYREALRRRLEGEPELRALSLVPP